MKPIVEVKIEVRYAETDQMGVVHHAVYPIWFEVARTRLCAEAGQPYAHIEEAGFFLVVSGVDVTYREAARYGDDLRVLAWVDWAASRALQFSYEIRRAGDLVASGNTRHVWVDRKTQRHCRMPDFLRGVFLRLSGQQKLAGPRRQP